MKISLLTATSLFLAFQIPQGFSQPLEGNCSDAAVKHALRTAPGIDPGSPASLLEIKLVKTQKLSAKETLEQYFVRTEDQGGTAASLISFKMINKSNLRDEVFRFECKFAGQKWVE